MGPIYSLDDLIDMIRRRAGVMTVVIVLGAMISLFLAWTQQHVYRSAEVLQIERPTIANDLAPSTVEGSSARRLQLIQQQLMARTNLQDIIDKYDLYSDLAALKPSEKIDRLRQAISIEGVAAAREGFADDGTISVLTITADMRSPELAQQVAHEFAERTRTLSAAQRAEQTRRTLEFFQRQEAALVAEIAALETEITAFRTENDLSIAGGVEFRRAEVASLNTALLEIDRNLVAARLALTQIDRTARQATIERTETEINGRIQSLEAQRAILEERRRRLTDSIDASPEIERALIDFDRQMEQLQNQLDGVAARRNEAQIGYRLEATEQGERLTIIEAAQLPDYPITPSRKKKAVLGAAGSVIAALVIAFLLDLRTPVIRTAAQMQREIGILPVVSIPEMKLPRTKPTFRERFAVWRAARRSSTLRRDRNGKALTRGD